MGNVEHLQYWLKHYREWNAFISHNGEMIQNYQKEMELEAAPAAVHYGPELKSGGPADSMEEQAILRKEKLQGRIRTLQARAQKAITRVSAIDGALSAMDPVDVELVKSRGINRMNWIATAAAIGYSEKTCREKYKALLKSMACMIFGDGI